LPGAVSLQLAGKVFIAWTGLRGAVAIFLASIPMLVGLSKAYLYFDVAFVVVIISLLLQGWTLAPAARRLHVALPRADRGPRRVELDLPGQLEQQLVGYPVAPRACISGAADSVLVEADAGDPRRAHSVAAEADPIAPATTLSAGAAGKGRGAGSLLRRHGAKLGARSASARRSSWSPGEHTLGSNGREIYWRGGRRGKAKLRYRIISTFISICAKVGAEK
jgi:hypothetical protein